MVRGARRVPRLRHLALPMVPHVHVVCPRHEQLLALDDPLLRNGRDEEGVQTWNPTGAMIGPSYKS